MNVSMRNPRLVPAAILAMAAWLGIPDVVAAEDFAEAEQVYAEHCAVCHGADRSGYIGPALNRDQTTLSEAEVNSKIETGSATTLMPQHPTWPRILSARKRGLLAALITKQPRKAMSWSMDDIRKSLVVLVADESTLPAKPVYPIEDIDDLVIIQNESGPLSTNARR